ncbi:pyridoxine 5'-phosphate synthase [Blastopirellula marina]|uniref:Pyridoxine 5'-phosphate synthase n=1 Tax=Blastopirellula marina TaxID=124 RepID=A0A2S8GBX1_9BACT|nr:pyridoxine 5'-phosphate synthase [Blastopirellula marina]PQO41937.1 pyridoxine 5'-phosphate synthase [Blastopirellula marina]PTL46295.1 pyridoxine 5'-phosphate synthase [Blastopirellula marina]
MPNLGVNIDHIATIRQARKTNEPDPVWAAALAELGGADCITLHLREDRRHIQDRDLEVMRQTVKVKLNLELAIEEEVVAIACRVKPDQVTLVPEKREEVTTEGGLDLVSHEAAVARAMEKLRDAGISINLFLDPEPAQIDMAAKLKADGIELHTGQYALHSGKEQQKELTRLTIAGEQIHAAGMELLAGHGLTYTNVQPVARIPEMAELNIGHSIISRAVFVGFRDAVSEMKRLVTV